MTSRRIPLGDVPNAANSPARPFVSQKRPREQNEHYEKSSFDLQPRVKRPALNTNSLRLRLSPASKPPASRDNRDSARPNASSHPTQFERRLLAAKDNEGQQMVQRTDKSSEELAGIRRWQQHYKKAFPGFVFYFESIPEELRAKYSKIVRNLGAKEEKFFSKSVTHLITNRSIPSQNENKGSHEPLPDQQERTSVHSNQPKTIDPALLEKSNESQIGLVSKGKFDFDAHMRRAHTNLVRDIEQTKPQSSGVDVLLKARELGVKIWQLNKLDRILTTIFEVPHDTQIAGIAQVSKRSGVAVEKQQQQRDADLSRMLRHERLHGPSDRAATSNLNEMVQFRGPYVLVRDIDERTKPILMKEWPKPTKKGDSGEWPQFRASGNGKCPFVEEIGRDSLQRQLARRNELEAQQRQAKPQGQSRSRHVSRVATPVEIFEDEEDVETEQAQRSQGPEDEPLQVSRSAVNIQHTAKSNVPEHQFCPPPPTLPSHSHHTPELQGKDRFGGIEPAASGLQPSNITSAIRSQVISSTASIPLSRAGTSREIHGLKRKVLEKNAGPALTTIHTKPTTGLSNGRAEAQISRARRDRVQSREAMAKIGEESAQTEEDEDVWLAEDVRASKASSRQEARNTSTKEAKPGYCENCREKYNDFDEHIVGRKHRRFALNPDNWKDLDRLLTKLVRPLKAPVADYVDGF